MKSYFLNTPIAINPTTLTGDWAKAHFTPTGDYVAAFLGDYNGQSTLDVTTPIPMLHFIMAHNGVSSIDLEFRKRFFYSLLASHMGEGFHRVEGTLFYFSDQLSISSSYTTSTTSLCHMGLFLISDDLLSPLVGLDHFDIDPEQLALKVLRLYCDECDDISHSVTL